MSVFGVQNAQELLCLGLFPGHVFIDFRIEFSSFETSKSSFSRRTYYKNQLFTEIVCFNIGVFCRRFLEAWGAVFLFLQPCEQA